MSAAHDVLVVGGTGFLGRTLATALLEAGHRVAVLSRGQHPPVPGAESLVFDRRETADMSRALEGRRFNVTVDLAAWDAADVERLLLVPYAALGRYLLISTGQVLLVTEGVRPPFREEDSAGRVRPEPEPGTTDHGQWSYGVGKRRAESALLALRASHGVRGVVLRLPVVLGEGDRTLRLWSYLERLLDGGPILLPEGGVQPTRFLYAGDFARQVVRMVASPPPREAVYHLAQPDVVPLRGLVERLARLAGVEPRLIDVSWEELARTGIDRSFSTYSGPWVSVLDPSRAAAEWGFLGTRLDDYLPGVVADLLARPRESHAGYALRPREIALATELAAAGPAPAGADLRDPTASR